MVQMTLSKGRAELRDELEISRRELSSRFRNSPPRTVGAGKFLAAEVDPSVAICHLVAGWACRYRNFLMTIKHRGHFFAWRCDRTGVDFSDSGPGKRSDAHFGRHRDDRCRGRTGVPI